jgi:hypothetical protein
MQILDMEDARSEGEADEVDTETGDEGAEEASSPPAGSAATPPAAEPAPDPGKERYADAFKKLAQRESRVVERERHYREQQAQFEAERQRIAYERHQVEQFRQQAEQEARRYRGLNDNPDVVAAFREAGLDFEDIVRRMANNNSPENMVKSTETKFLSHLERLEKQLEEERTWRKNREEQEQEQASAYQIRQAREWAASHVTQNHEKYPELSLRRPGEIAGRIEFVAEQMEKRTGRAPHIDVVAKIVEDQLAQEEKERLDARSKRSAPKPPAAAATSGKTAARSASAAPVSARGDEPEDEGLYEHSIAQRRKNRFLGPTTPAPIPVERVSTITNRVATERGAAAPRESRAELRDRLRRTHLG